MKKTEEAKPKPSKFTKSNYRRATDGVEIRRVTFDLPEELLHRWTVHAAKLRTTKVRDPPRVARKGNTAALAT